MSHDELTFEIATGPHATQAIDTLDAIEPLLVAFIRGTARWLDPWFPQLGTRGVAERGAWTEGAVRITMQQVEELGDGRGVRIIRLYRAPTSGAGAHGGAIRLQAVGLTDGVQLEVRWNFDATESGLRGTSAELTVDGVHHEECVADFRCWFGS